MKKVNLLLLGVAVGFMGLFSGCQTSDSTSGPVITFTNNQDAADVTTSSWTITGNITSDAGLDEVKFIKVIGSDETQLGAAITRFTDKNNFNFSQDITGITGDMAIKVTATDKNNITTSKSFTITFKGSAGAISTYSNVKMGGSSSSFGSYLDAETGTPYTSSQVNGSATIKNSIDIIFDAGKVWNSASSGIIFSGTGTKFATTTLTVAQFDAIADDATIAALDGTLDSTPVAANSVVFFKTAAGKKGLLKVISMTSSTGDLTIDIKIQK